MTMRKSNIVCLGLVTAGSLGLAGCDVQKTQEGDVDLPKYEVTQTKEGDVQLPKYDVTAPDVSVTTKEKTITVPSVEVKTAEEKKKEAGK
jgi:hypothetical protein